VQIRSDRSPVYGEQYGGIAMRKSSLTLLAAAIGLAASQASAADLPRKAPAYVPPAPPPITWTGCYIGANVGGIFGRREADFGLGLGELSTNNSGFAGGGQIGCDYQFAGGWVIGFRNMFDGSSLSRDRTFFDPITGASATVDFHNNWFDTLTGRIGYSVTPAWLWYFQGGVAWAKNSADVTINVPALGVFDAGSFSRTRTGWTIGGGVEWRFAPQWSAFLEGNWMDFGSNDHTLVDPTFTLCPAGGCAFNTKATAATVLVGVNYRFGGWGKAPY
jgi:outer membrane immunogenic protein